jgi:membrane-associated phospholipid phosphatase
VDGSVFQSINRFAARTDWAHGFMRFYANRGVVVFAVFLLVGYLLARSRSDLSGVAGSLWAGGAALIALGLAQVIGNVVDRARPYETLANVQVLVDKTTDFSFPSDHATLVGAVAVGLFFVDRWLGLAAAIAAVVMAFTRVYVGAHYPGDVLAGLALGGVVAWLGHIVVVPVLRRMVLHVADSRFRWLVASHESKPGTVVAS